MMTNDDASYEASFSPVNSIVTGIRFSGGVSFDIRSSQDKDIDVRLSIPFTLTSCAGLKQVDVTTFSNVGDLVAAVLYQTVTRIDITRDAALVIRLGSGGTIDCGGGAEYESWSLAVGEDVLIGGVNGKLVRFDGEHLRLSDVDLERI